MRPPASPNHLVIRAVFVPDGEEPPPDVAATMSPLRFRATLDPETGILAGDSEGNAFGGDLLAEWVPDSDDGEAFDAV